MKTNFKNMISMIELIEKLNFMIKFINYIKLNIGLHGALIHFK